MRINKYEPLKWSSYIDLPENIKSKKAIINVKSKGNKYYMLSILSVIHSVKKYSQRISKYEKYKNELNFEGIEFPAFLNNIKCLKNLITYR